MDRIETTPQTEDAWAVHVSVVAHGTLYPKAASWYRGANISGKPRVFMPYLGVDVCRRKWDAIAAEGYPDFRMTKTRVPAAKVS